MRSEYFSSKEPGALFFPGGPPEYSQAELSGLEPASSQRTSLPDNLRSAALPKEIKGLQRENEAVRILAAKVEADFTQLLEEEDELTAEIEEVKKLEKILQTRESLLRLLDSDVVTKQKELETLKSQVSQQMQLLQAEKSHQTALEDGLEDSRLKGESKSLELLNRRRVMQISTKQLSQHKKDRIDAKMTSLLQKGSSEHAQKAFDSLDTPSDYLDVQTSALPTQFLQMLRVRRQMAQQRQNNAELFARVRLLAPE